MSFTDVTDLRQILNPNVLPYSDKKQNPVRG